MRILGPRSKDGRRHFTPEQRRRARDKTLSAIATVAGGLGSLREPSLDQPLAVMLAVRGMLIVQRREIASGRKAWFQSDDLFRVRFCRRIVSELRGCRSQKGVVRVIRPRDAAERFDCLGIGPRRVLRPTQMVPIAFRMIG